MRRGQQSYPLAIDGTLYVTTNNNFVFALDGVTGKVKWEYRPRNSGLFVNFGVAANRGLAYCGGKLFMTTLDMQLVALRPSDGEVVGKIAISQFVPNASANYGYSQTSAPICAGGKLVMGAAGSEYGVRGYVMAFNTDLTPAWPNPYWTIPPEQQQWRRLSRIVGGGVVWTPVTIDTRTSTVYFGTGSGTPNFYHDLHPGPNPRANSLIAVDLNTGKQRWWRQLVANDQWNYDVAQPPLVYDAKIGGKTRRIVSVASKEGVWFALDARSGQMLHERVKVIDRVEHPPLRPGQPVTIFPSALGGVNYSPASYDPATNYVFNAAAETAAVLIQDKLTPTQKRRKLIQGDVFLGLQNGNFGTGLESWRDHGSISAINVATGKRVWKFQTPEPERGGVTTTASGLGFAGGGDGVLRAFDLRNGRVLWRFQTGAPIAAGPTLYLSGGKEYLAITVGGTPTSSNGGVAAELQVFAIGGNQQQSVAAVRADTRGVRRGRGAERRRHADGDAGGRPRAGGSRGGSTPLDGRPDRGARLAPVRRQHRDRDGKAARRRQARRRCADRRRPLRPEAADRPRRPLQRPHRRHRRAPSRRQGRRPLEGPRRRAPAHERGARGGARRDRAASRSRTASTTSRRAPERTGTSSSRDGSRPAAASPRPPSVSSRTGCRAGSPARTGSRSRVPRSSRARSTATSGRSRSRRTRTGTTRPSSPRRTSPRTTRCRSASRSRSARSRTPRA